MKKDKLITVRISEDLQSQFNQWLKLNRLSGAEFLRGVIEGCVSGNISPENLNLDYQLDSIGTIDNQQVKTLETRLEELERKLSSYMSSQDRQMESLKDELKKLVTDSQARQDSSSYTKIDKTRQTPQERKDSIDNDSQVRKDDSNIYAKSLDNYGINIPSVAVEETSEPVTVIENEETPPENEAEKQIDAEPIIIPEVKNDSVKSDSERANSENKFNFVDTVEEIRRLNSQGLIYAQIAKRLTDANYPTKQGKYKWTGTQVKRILDKS